MGDALGSIFEGFWVSDWGFDGYSGRWTDDTHMMIGVAESLISCGAFDGSHMAQTFIKNYEEEPWRGYASGPPQVFRLIKRGLAWSEASKRLFGGLGSYGNGAAMRVAPVGLLHYDNEEKLRSVAYAQSQITHAHELGMEGAAIQAYAVALAVKADSSSRLDPYDFLGKIKDFTRSEVYRQKIEKCLELLNEANKRKVSRELGNGVEAYNSVPAAIYSFSRNVDSFRDAVTYAISLGGDTDTIGAMTGAISGAYHGVEKIPEEWKNRLEKIDYIEKLAEELWNLKNKKGE
ncbi:MAG: ADP-ribosylglycohydrolase family protein [Candidatus Freyarchaeota archaeon]|nr:ADP-ribosylglycohydrolase family protein [Candidatus Jordarchaeia archaeon]MBS7269204.1 ADP-ribosylglycohydrolase family protein [Candidatus Jordarchaeia archaeon]MBS7279565.1 ADP-ribosylglycohydrolase family protein [Candidatus Jordarchaeia archaeon]